MTDLTTDTPDAPQVHHTRGGLSRVMPWLLVPFIGLLGGCAMVLQAMLLEGETLRGLAAEPDLWGARLPAALTGIAPSWIALTLDGLVTGMLIFLVAAGLTLVIGLMGVVKLAHGALLTIGAFAAVSVLARFGDWTASIVPAPDLALIAAAALVAIAVAGVAGALFRGVNVRPGGGSRLQQILVTVGVLIIAERVIPMIWGPAEIVLDRPAALNGFVSFHGVMLETLGLLAAGIGVTVVVLLALVWRHTRTGLVLRAAMQDREMVQALGYRLRAIGVGVFIAGAALAGVGGMLWALHMDVVTAQTGGHLMVLVVVTVMIGGLGSVTGCFLAALVIGLAQGYTAFFDPGLVLVSAIALLVLVLLWRPAGILARAS